MQLKNNNIVYNGIKLGHIYKECDGFYVFQPNTDGRFWSEWALKGIWKILADKNSKHPANFDEQVGGNLNKIKKLSPKTEAVNIKSKINDILLNLQNNKIDVGVAANNLLTLFEADENKTDEKRKSATNLRELKKELEPFRNTLVIDVFDKVVRLVDVVDDEDDYYWVYDSRQGVYQSSCVCGWIPLKGFIKEKEYNEMIRVWNLNNMVKAV